MNITIEYLIEISHIFATHKHRIRVAWNCDCEALTILKAFFNSFFLLFPVFVAAFLPLLSYLVHLVLMIYLCPWRTTSWPFFASNPWLRIHWELQPGATLCIWHLTLRLGHVNWRPQGRFEGQKPPTNIGWRLQLMKKHPLDTWHYDDLLYLKGV